MNSNGMNQFNTLATVLTSITHIHELCAADYDKNWKDIYT